MASLKRLFYLPTHIVPTADDSIEFEVFTDNFHLLMNIAKSGFYFFVINTDEDNKSFFSVIDIDAACRIWDAILIAYLS